MSYPYLRAPTGSLKSAIHEVDAVVRGRALSAKSRGTTDETHGVPLRGARGGARPAWADDRLRARRPAADRGSRSWRIHSADDSAGGPAVRAAHEYVLFLVRIPTWTHGCRHSVQTAQLISRQASCGRTDSPTSPQRRRASAPPTTSTCCAASRAGRASLTPVERFG